MTTRFGHCLVAPLFLFTLIVFCCDASGQQPTSTENASTESESTEFPEISGSAQRGEMTVREDIPITAYPNASYDQPRRPQYHFSSRKNWINDPNGLVHDGQRYHMFFQHNPLGTQWGNMSWGHATSVDLVHWEQQPHALLPYTVDGRTGDIWSGTAIIDHRNSLGKQVSEVPTIVAFFTFASEPAYYTAMAYSTDRCKTWTLYDDGRAVIPNQGLDPKERDPKVFWHGPSEQWGLVLWVDRDSDSGMGTLRFFTSDNLVDWQFACDVVRPWAFECPDIFFASVDYEGEPKTVLYDASGDYEIGHFDGQDFVSETEPLKFGGDGDLYATQLFNNEPTFRNIAISWMRNSPDLVSSGELPFQCQMAFPVEFKLKSTDAGPRLHANPIRELQPQITDETRFGPLTIPAGQTVSADGPAVVDTDTDLTIKPGDASQITFKLGGLEFVYVVDSEMLQMNAGGTMVPLMKDLETIDGEVTLRLMIDRMSVEVFAEGGLHFTAKYALPVLNPSPPSFTAVISEDSTNPPTIAGVIREIGSIWN